MSVNLEQYKPVTYLVFTTNALRNNIGDGTLEFYHFIKRMGRLTQIIQSFHIATNLQ